MGQLSINGGFSSSIFDYQSVAELLFEVNLRWVETNLSVQNGINGIDSDSQVIGFLGCSFKDDAFSIPSGTDKQFANLNMAIDSSLIYP